MSAPSDRISVQSKVLNWFDEEEPDNDLLKEQSIELLEEPELLRESPGGSVDRYRTLATGTSAYHWLLSAIRKELTLVVEQEEILGNIHKEVGRILPPISKISTRRQADAVKVLYVLLWDPTTFISEQEYSEERTMAMERAITLTGTLRSAQALPCLQYMRQTWPTNGEQILRLIQKLMDSKCGNIIRGAVLL